MHVYRIGFIQAIKGKHYDEKREIIMTIFFEFFRDVYHIIYSGIMLIGCCFIYYHLFKKQ
jgi:hypothetical protein